MRVGRPPPFVYVLRCRDGTLYTGWTTDLGRRLRAHAAGAGAKYTRSRRPLELVAFARRPDRSAAMSLEARFKALTRAGKLRALDRPQVLGARFHKPPHIHPAPGGSPMPALQAPTDAETQALTEEARTHRVRIETPKGAITVKLYPDQAPKHVAAFLNLVHQGFYDGLTFHRVEPGFVVQGGCPSGDGTGGPGYRLPAEFNEHKHRTGTLAMARTSDPNSAGSQFYLCLADTPFLDGQYTVFGDTVAGLDVLPKIKRGDAMTKLTVVPADEAGASA